MGEAHFPLESLDSTAIIFPLPFSYFPFSSPFSAPTLISLPQNSSYQAPSRATLLEENRSGSFRYGRACLR